MQHRTRFCRWLLAALALFICIDVSTAQTRSGAISGTLTSGDGRPVPGARVEAENIDTAQRFNAVTDDQGQYRFDRIPLGRYRVTFPSAPAGPTNTPEMVDVQSEEGVQVRMRSVDNTSSASPITDATSPVGETQTAQIFKTFNTSKVQHLPQPNLIEMDGWAFGAYNLGLMPAGVVAAGGVSVSGQPPSSNNFHIEGIDNNNRALTGPLVYLPNEATSEFVLFQNRKSGAWLGHAAGGELNSIVRTGTNRVHGSIYNYLQNRHLNAMDRRLMTFGLENSPRFDQNRLGASLGLPVIPNTMFFFGNFEYIPLGFQGAPGDLVTFAPTAAGYTALSQLAATSRQNLNILSQQLGTAPQGTQNLQVGGRNVAFGPILSSRRNFQNQYIGMGALDWNFANVDSLHFRYVHNEREANFNGATLAGFQSPVQSRSLVANVSHYHTFFSVLTNELRAGYTRWDNRTSPNDAQFPGLGAFPSIRIPADVNLNFGPSTAPVMNGAVNTFHLADNLGVTWRGHNLRFGFDARRSMSTLSGFPAANGIYQYSSLQRFLSDLPPDVQSVRAFNPAPYNGNQWSWFGYINDRFTPFTNFNIDVGLGYQYTTVPTSARLQAFNAAASVPGVLEFAEPRAQQWNWAPKIGVAFSPGMLTGTTFRAGFGVQYDALSNPLQYLPAAPQLGAVTYGDLTSQTPGFLARGGLTAPAATGLGLTPAQARAQTTSFIADQQLPYTMQWNAGLQQQIFGMVIEAKYLGSRTQNIPIQTRLNSIARVSVARSLPVYYLVPSFNSIDLLPLSYEQIQIGQASQLSQFGFTNPIRTTVNEGQSTYHALAAEVRHRFTGGFQMLGSYTWSHLIDDVAYGTFQDGGDRSGDRADSIFDRRHRAVVTGLWEPGTIFGNSILRNIVANATLGGTFTYQSPGYATPLSGFDSNLDGDGTGDRAIFNSNGAEGTSAGTTALTNSRGQLVGYVAGSNAQYVRSPLGSFVQASRNTFRLGQINNFDVFAVKRFSYRERFGFEVRGDAYNVFNHAQYTNDPVRTLLGASDTTLASTLIAGSNNFGNLSLLGSRPRMLQVALRVTF